MMIVKIELFGRVRDFFDTNPLILEFAKTASINEVKAKIASLLDNESAKLLENCVLANDEDILLGDSIISRDSELMILPPVSGG